jgi:hypothetical protein
MWMLATARLEATSLIASLCNSFLSSLACTPRDISIITWSLAQLNFKSPSVVVFVTEHFTENLGSYSPAEICRLIWALPTLGLQGPKLQKVADIITDDMASEMGSIRLARLITSLKLGGADAQRFSNIGSQKFLKLNDPSVAPSTEGAEVLVWALGIEPKSENFERVLEAHFEQRSGRFADHEVALLLSVTPVESPIRQSLLNIVQEIAKESSSVTSIWTLATNGALSGPLNDSDLPPSESSLPVFDRALMLQALLAANDKASESQILSSVNSVTLLFEDLPAGQLASTLQFIRAYLLSNASRSETLTLRLNQVLNDFSRNVERDHLNLQMLVAWDVMRGEDPELDRLSPVEQGLCGLKLFDRISHPDSI